MGWKMKNVIALFVVLALIYWQQSAFADMIYGSSREPISIEKIKEEREI